MSSLSHEDFERLQTSLIELKNQNYQLEENFRKQKSALGDATARATVLDQELTKAQKIIQKSKKVTEVQGLVRDNESLQRKLVCQEEDFRIQNQTLLDELSKLVSLNERLESKIRNLSTEDTINGNDLSSSQDESLRVEISSLRDTLANVEDERDTLSRENERLQSLMMDAAQCESTDVSESGSSEVVEVSNGGVGVVFRRQSSSNFGNDSFSGESQSSFKRLKEEVSKLTEEKFLFKNENRNFQEQLSQLHEKLRKKQESFLNIQDEKEKIFKDLSKQLDEVKMSNESEVVQLRDQVGRLQVQLNHGHTGFAEFKEKKMTEILALQTDLQKLKEQNVACSPEKQSELTAQIICLNDELSGLKSRFAEVSQEKDNLLIEVNMLKSNYEKATSQNEELSRTFNDLNEKLDAAVKTSEKRKGLLDEMAIRVQTKTEESNSTIEKLEQDLNLKLEELEEREREVEQLGSKCESQSEKLKQLQSQVVELESSKADLEKELQTLAEQSQKTNSDLIESHLDEIRMAKSESELRARDLSMQLEIANVQKNEFEEQATNLLQDIQDLCEEKKIMEKKNQNLVKDLKRQLVSEQLRNEKLSEKMKDLLTDPPSFSEPDRRNEIEPDRTSNSSWSIYSGHNELPRDPATTSTPRRSKSKSNSNDSLSQIQMMPNLSPPNSPAVNAGYSEEDYRAMLTKISSLQEENVLMQQRIEMLEHSSGAMADDLLRKSKLIQYYCMEGKTAIRQNSVPSNPMLPNEKLKKMVDLLVHSNQDSQKEEFQRMQRMLEETLTKNMHLQKDLEHLSQEVLRLKNCLLE